MLWKIKDIKETLHLDIFFRLLYQLHSTKVCLDEALFVAFGVFTQIRPVTRILFQFCVWKIQGLFEKLVKK